MALWCRFQRLQAVEILSEGAFRLIDRKLKLARLRGRVLCAHTNGGGVDAVVQRTSEIVEPFPNEHRHGGWRGHFLVNTHDETPATFMNEDELVRVLLEELIPHCSCRSSMRRCAVDASPTRVKQCQRRVGHGASRRRSPQSRRRCTINSLENKVTRCQ
jgi:hypothetical protein